MFFRPSNVLCCSLRKSCGCCVQDDMPKRNFLRITCVCACVGHVVTLGFSVLHGNRKTAYKGSKFANRRMCDEASFGRGQANGRSVYRCARLEWRAAWFANMLRPIRLSGAHKNHRTCWLAWESFSFLDASRRRLLGWTNNVYARPPPRGLAHPLVLLSTSCFCAR
jgi:hypothetical protein